MIRLLLLNALVLVGVLGLMCGLLGIVVRRRRSVSKELVTRLHLTPACSRRLPWAERWLGPECFQGLYRGHEIAIERHSKRNSGRLRYYEVLRFACPYPSAPSFEIIPVSSLTFSLRKRNSTLTLTGDASFDRSFAVKTRSPSFVLEVLSEPIRKRLLETFYGRRSCGIIRFSEDELTYEGSNICRSLEAVDGLEAVVQRFYELSLAVKIFTQKNESHTL